MSDESSSSGSSHFTNCPECNAPLMVYRSDKPQIDSFGFETCSLKCWKCATQLAGIIDPLDETLLLSKIEDEDRLRRLSKAS